jgi:hypothetical protein
MKEFFSQSYRLSIILSILIIFSVQPSKAQPAFYPKNKPMLRSDHQEACWRLPELALTQTQGKTLESLQCAYSAEAMPLARGIRTPKKDIEGAKTKKILLV